MNVILPAPGIPVLRLFVLEHNCLVPGLSDYKHLYTFKIITIFNNENISDDLIVEPG